MGPKNSVGVRELNLFYTFFSSTLKFSQPRSQKGEENFVPKEKTECSRFCLRDIENLI